MAFGARIQHRTVRRRVPDPTPDRVAAAVAELAAAPGDSDLQAGLRLAIRRVIADPEPVQEITALPRPATGPGVFNVPGERFVAVGRDNSGTISTGEAEEAARRAVIAREETVAALAEAAEAVDGTGASGAAVDAPAAGRAGPRVVVLLGKGMTVSARTTSALRPAGLLFALYHLLTLALDAERCARNLRIYREAPSGANLIRLLLAEGVLVKDLGLGA